MADSIEPTAAARPPVGPGGAALILGAIGVVFGDIGTSPLYTLQECLHSRHGVAPRPENVPRVPAALGPTLAKHGIAGNPGEITYIIGRETLVASRQGHMGRLTEPLFVFLARNARSTTDHFWIPVEQVVEVGIQLDL